ncbi:MAG: PKD-like domain-containing protein [Mariniphaga sp.]
MLTTKFWYITFFFAGLALFSSCSKSGELTGPMISMSVPSDGFKIEMGKSLPLNPAVSNSGNSTYTWKINGEIVSTEKIFLFTPLKIGSYTLQLKVSNDVGSDNKTIQISAFSNLSPYITTVFDYRYGPGQHASLIPSDCKAQDFIGQPWIGSKQYTSLGGWGGYIIAGFDHTIKNIAGADFAIFTQPGAGSEPGIVYIMSDSNNDGIPNDGDWAEIKGSEYNNPETIHNYEVTYYKPLANGNVTWKDNKGGNGELKPVFDSSSWWWIGYGNKMEMVFSGSKLPDAYKNNSTQTGIENWIVRTGIFTSGYAECYNNGDYINSLKANAFDISNAVDKAGNPVNLAGFTFIKVQSGVFQVAGWLNEISTEVSGAVDLSIIEYSAN